jgi:hypothetical protein
MYRYMQHYELRLEEGISPLLRFIQPSINIGVSMQNVWWFDLDVYLLNGK